MEFLGSYVTIILKEEERQVDHKTDGKINSCNPKIGTGQTA
jgi:hypothetical protein